MDDDLNAPAFQHFVMDVIVDLVRTGVIPPGTMERIEDRWSHRGGEFGDKIAAMAAGVALEASIPYRSPREAEAEYHRRQMRERTAFYERKAALTAVTSEDKPA